MNIVNEILENFKNNKELYIGEKVTITPLLIGVDNWSPLKNINIFIHIPNSEAETILK